MGQFSSYFSQLDSELIFDDVANSLLKSGHDKIYEQLSRDDLVFLDFFYDFQDFSIEYSNLYFYRSVMEYLRKKYSLKISEQSNFLAGMKADEFRAYDLNNSDMFLSLAYEHQEFFLYDLKATKATGKEISLNFLSCSKEKFLIKSDKKLCSIDRETLIHIMYLNLKLGKYMLAKLVKEINHFSALREQGGRVLNQWPGYFSQVELINQKWAILEEGINSASNKDIKKLLLYRDSILSLSGKILGLMGGYGYCGKKEILQSYYFIRENHSFILSRFLVKKMLLS